MEGEEDGEAIGAGVSKDLDGLRGVGDFDEGVCRSCSGED